MAETGAMIAGKPGDRLVIDFNTRVPLTDGNYNVLVLIIKPVIPGRSANYIDSIKNAFVFRVLEREPYRLWSKAYSENKVTVRSVQGV